MDISIYISMPLNILTVRFFRWQYHVNITFSSLLARSGTRESVQNNIKEEIQ